MNARAICPDLERLKADGADLQALLTAAVERLHETGKNFHWTGVYELYPDNVLRLGPFVGAPTDHVFIAVGRGVCGTAVAEQRNVNVPDVSKVPNYLACSTATKSELVILIRKNGRIFGQIDIDSHVLNAFDDESVAHVQAVADWLAEAYAMSDSAVGAGRQ
jgi:GAF domain-containing protein